MAEIAIPLLAIGGYFIASRESTPKPNTREGMSNSTISNMNTRTPNYPSSGTAGAVKLPDERPGMDVKQYKQPSNQYTDKYYNPKHADYVQPSTGGGQIPMNIETMSGDTVSKTAFEHNNMVPFFGGKSRGSQNDRSSRSILDNLQGAGSLHKQKSEKAPLFAPDKNAGWQHGAPNNSDFYASRVNASMRMANTKPWEEERVGPALGQGAGNEGMGGFNSGMIGREMTADRGVDDLRTASNPKQSYELGGYEGPAQSKIVEMGKMGLIEKRAPDTYYENTSNRWLTTTGASLNQTAHSEQMMGDVNRTSTTRDYFGNGGDVGSGDGGYKNQGEYKESTKINLGANPISNAAAAGRNPGHATDYGSKSYQNIPNNRSYNPETTWSGSIGGVVGAMIAPIIDVIRPTRKDMVIENNRITGNVQIAGAKGGSDVFDRQSSAPTTNREMIESSLDSGHWNYQGQSSKNDGYTITDVRADNTNRQTTSHERYGVGAAGGIGETSYSSAYKQRNNANKTYAGRTNQGGTQMFNTNVNMKIDKRDADRNNIRSVAPTRQAMSIPTMNLQGDVRAPQQLDSGYSGESSRMDPSLLDAFKSNPYTHGLNKAV